MLYYILLLLISVSCNVNSSDQLFDPDSFPSIPTFPDQNPDPESFPPTPDFPNLDVNSWKYLTSTKILSGRMVSSEHITVSDNNTPYISFLNGGKIYVYRWSGNDWIQIGSEISAESHHSLITFKNIPYITYIANNKSFVQKYNYNSNTWINAHNDNTLSTTEKLRVISLYPYQNRLYLMYVEDTSKKLHIKYLNNKSWESCGETSNDRFDGSVNNGIQMSFYNNTPYIALKRFFDSEPVVLILRNNKWEPISAPNIPNRKSLYSDYFFYIDSNGIMYLSFLSDTFASTLGTFEIFKLYNNKWNTAIPFSNKIYGYQTILYQKKLYIAYSHSLDPLVQKEDKVQFDRFDEALALENKDMNIISDLGSTGANVKIAIKDNRIYALYLDRKINSLVIKSSLLK